MKKFIIEEQDCFIKTNGIIRLPHSLKYGEQAVSVCPKHKLAPLKTPLDWFRVTPNCSPLIRSLILRVYAMLRCPPP